MTFSEIVDAVMRGLQKFDSLGVAARKEEVVASINNAQMSVARDLLTYADKTDPDGVTPDLLRAMRNPPRMTVGGTVEPLLPPEAHDALVAASLLELAPLFGAQPGAAPRPRQALLAEYGQKLQAARHALAISKVGQKDAVRDYYDPERFSRAEF